MKQSERGEGRASTPLIPLTRRRTLFGATLSPTRREGNGASSMTSATRFVMPVVAAFVIIGSSLQPAFADPRRAPTADFIIDVEVTRDTDHALRAPARYVSVGRKIRVDYNGLSTLY